MASLDLLIEYYVLHQQRNLTTLKLEVVSVCIGSNVVSYTFDWLLVSNNPESWKSEKGSQIG